MPELPPYTFTGPIDPTVPLDKSELKGKSVIVTGGAIGLGEEIVRSFAAAGSYVTFGDTDATRGPQVENDIKKNGGNVKFVSCDITNWEDQVRMFEAAIVNSPNKSCDIVIANAGISRSSGDSLWKLDDPNGPPIKPALNITNVNINGTLFTFKLAVHYFRKQPENTDRDSCFIMTGSMAGYIDSPGNWEYTVSKHGLRGLMCGVRRSSPDQGIRINYVAPYYVKSAIRTAETEKRLRDKGVDFGTPEDVAGCMMHIAADRKLNGHSMVIVSRSVAKQGFMDVEADDYVDNGYLNQAQEIQLRVIEDRWFD